MPKTAPEVLTEYIKYLVLSDKLANDEWSETTIADYVNQTKEELRSGTVETNVPPEYARHRGHFESRSVAMFVEYEHFAGYIGWTYWYGGGKHTYPEYIDWVKDAYFLDCVEEQVVTIKRTWSKQK